MITYRWFLYKNRIRGKLYSFKFRGATRKELALAGTLSSMFEAENYLLSKVVEGEHDFLQVPAGVVQTLLDQILDVTGINEKEKTWHEALAWLESDDGQKEIMAMSVFPWCSKEYLDNCDPSYYAKTVLGGKYCFDTALGGMLPEQNTRSSTSKIPVGDNKDLHVSTETVKFK